MASDATAVSQRSVIARGEACPHKSVLFQRLYFRFDVAGRGRHGVFLACVLRSARRWNECVQRRVSGFLLYFCFFQRCLRLEAHTTVIHHFLVLRMNLCYAVSCKARSHQSEVRLNVSGKKSSGEKELIFGHKSQDLFELIFLRE